jgi:hypothetical protein
MPAKRIQVSSDNGSTWLTLPGNTGGLSHEADELPDTIFGQNWQSNEVGLIASEITSNGLYKGFAGYHADIQKSGSSTSFTGEATSNSGEASKVYRISDATKNFWNHAVAVVVLDGVTDVTDEVEWIDYLFGKIKFQGSFTPSGAVTFNGAYFPKTTVAKGRTFNITQTMEPIDDTDFASAQANGGRRIYDPGLRTASLEIGGIYDATNGWKTALEGRAVVLIEIAPVGNSGSESRFRGIFKTSRQGHEGDVGALEEETVNFTLHVPDSGTNPTVGFDTDLYYTPFRWDHPSGTLLSSAVRAVLTAWENETEIDARYLPDGTNGFSAAIVVAEASLTGGVEALNEFSFTFNIVGALTAVP